VSDQKLETTKQQLQLATTTEQESKELPYYCSCGKRFATWRSLRGHCASTGHAMPDEFKKKKEEVSRLSSKRGTQEEGGVPDEKENLKILLNKHGIRNAEIIADLMANRDWDDLYSLVEYLRLSRVPNDRILLVVEDWSVHRRIAVPDDLLLSLNAPPDYVPPTYSTIRRPGQFRRPVYEDEVSRDALSAIVQGLTDMNKILLSKITNNSNPNPPATTDNSRLDLLLEKFNNLDERLKRLEEGEAKKFKEKELEVQRESINKQYEVQKAGLDLIKQQLQSINRKTDLALRTIIEIGSGNKIKIKPIRNHEGEIIGFEPSPASSYQIRKEEENAELTEEEIERLRELGIPVEEE